MQKFFQTLMAMVGIGLIPVVSHAEQAGAKSETSAKPEVIKAEKARENIDKTMTVELTVKSSNKAASSERYYLDSEEDYKSETNLAIVISFETAKAMEKDGIRDVIAYFSGKKIKVTGKIVRNSDQTRIFVTDPKQIELIKN